MGIEGRFTTKEGSHMDSREEKSVNRALNECSAGRLPAKQAIREHIERMRREADRLEALLGFIPDALSPQADEALWSLAISL